MKVSILTENGETKQYKVDGENNNCQAVMVSLEPTEKDSFCTGDPATNPDFCVYESEKMSREEILDWMGEMGKGQKPGEENEQK